MATISLYHLNIMIVSLVRDASVLERTDWIEWINRISRIYNHKIPKSLIESLAKLNIPELDEFVKSQRCVMTENNKKKAKQIAEVEARYAQWIHRRDSGNQRVHRERLDKIQRELDEAREKAKCAHDAYVKKMAPEWDRAISCFVKQRETDRLKWMGL